MQFLLQIRIFCRPRSDRLAQ